MNRSERQVFCRRWCGFRRRGRPPLRNSNAPRRGQCAASFRALGLMLAMNAGEISVQGDSSRHAAGYWYRSALLLESSGPLPAPLLEYAAQVLGTVARDSAGRGQNLAFAQAVELAFEQARLALASQGKSMPRPCVDRHAAVLRELVWPRLTQAVPGDAWRVVLSAWTATGRESLVCQWAAKSLASGRAGLASVAEGLGVDDFSAWLARMFCEFGVRLGVPAWLELGREVRRLMDEPAFGPGTCNRVELLQSMVELLHQARMVTR